MLTYSTIFPASCRCRWNYAIASSARIFPQYFRTRTQMSWIYGHSREWCATNALLFCRPSRLRLSPHRSVFCLSLHRIFVWKTRTEVYFPWKYDQRSALLSEYRIFIFHVASEYMWVCICVPWKGFICVDKLYIQRAICEFICGLCGPHCAVMFYRVNVSNLLVYCLYHFIAKHTYLSEFSY